MRYTGYELLWLFFIYSFLGWSIETAAASGRKREFVNRGFFTGPVCFIYGTSAILMTVTLGDLRENPVFLFLGCALQATLLEWIVGKTLERINHHKWWDYSSRRWNFDGYICLSYSLLWGALGVLAICYGNEIIAVLFRLMPGMAGKLAIWILAGTALLDSVASFAALFHLQKRIPTVCRFDTQLGVWTHRLRVWIISHTKSRMVKAYPGIAREARIEERQGHFAEGCGFYKLFWLFFIGAFLGDIVETLFCRYSMGRWMSRSSLVWGEFSVVWGVAIVLATALLHKDKDKSDAVLFGVGTFWGGVYEYACSVFTELVFGKVFWDYSKIPFNLGGRINLLFCFFWGIAAVVWIKLLYPKISGWIEKIPQTAGKAMSWLMILFIITNMAVSALALVRYDTRSRGQAARYKWEKVMDESFDDARMEKKYPSAKPR